MAGFFRPQLTVETGGDQQVYVDHSNLSTTEASGGGTKRRHDSSR